jgi:hypothetical protein
MVLMEETGTMPAARKYTLELRERAGLRLPTAGRPQSVVVNRAAFEVCWWGG